MTKVEKVEKVENVEAVETKELSKDDIIANLREQLSSTTEKQKDLENKVGILMGIADKRAVNDYLSKGTGKLTSTVRLRTLDGKVVIGWRTIKDNGAYKDPRTLFWKEEQVIELTFEDETTLEIDYAVFNKQFSYEEFIKKGVITDDETGDTIFVLVSSVDNRELKVSATFIN